MRTKLLATVAAATFATALAAGSAFAQDEQIPKRNQMQQGGAATQQQPANNAEMPKKRLGEQSQQTGTDQPSSQQAEQAQPQKRKPAENADTSTPAERKQVGQSNCQAGQDANCPPTKQKMGEQQPANGMKPKANVTEQQTDTNQRRKMGQQQQPEDQNQRQQMGQQQEDQNQLPKKRLTGQGEQQPASPGGKQMQTGQAQGTSRTDVDVTGSLNVSKDKASRVRDTLFRSGERTDVDVNVNVDVGQALPARVRPRPLPPEIVDIVPEYRGYDYVIVQQQIVIVEPQTRKVVEIIRQRGGGGQQAHRTGGIRLTSEQRQQILSYAKQRNITTVRRSFDVTSGASVPSDVELAPLPDTVISEVPDIRSYQFFVTGDQGDQIVLVDPDSHSIVDVE